TYYFGDHGTERETAELVCAALERMRDEGAEVLEVAIEGLDELLAGTALLEFEFKWDLADYLARTPGASITSLRQIIEDGRYTPAVAERLHRADRQETRDMAAYTRALERRAALRGALLATLDRYGLDALAYPSL